MRGDVIRAAAQHLLGQQRATGSGQPVREGREHLDVDRATTKERQQHPILGRFGHRGLGLGQNTDRVESQQRALHSHIAPQRPAHWRGHTGQRLTQVGSAPSAAGDTRRM
jgi:hypothetical protein